MTGVPTTAARSHTVLRRIIELACRAPSVHNTQPWRWRIHGSDLELHADPSRQLQVGDPQGRNLVISCGAALHHAQVAAGTLGWESRVDRVPYGTASTLLARLAFTPTEVPAGSVELMKAIERRCTDRRRFTSWPVPPERLAHLAARASAWGTRALPLLDATDHFRAELLEHRAFERQRQDERINFELHDWVELDSPEGIPSSVRPRPDRHAGDRPRRFPAGVLEESEGREVESADGLIVLCSPDDDALAWLQAGEGLSALWLAATVDGLSVVPLSQVVEVPETREALQREVLGGLAQPLDPGPGRLADHQSQRAAADPAPPRRRRPRLIVNLRWVVACAAAETVGMSASAGAARAADGLAPAVALLLVVGGGLVEGTALGAAQATVLRPRLGRSGARAWVWATVVVAGLGWGAGSAPATLAGDDGGTTPALGLVLLGATGLGLAMGALLGAAQAVVLRRRVRHPWRWVTANACGWAVAMAVIFAGATTAAAGWSWPVLLGYGALTGAVAGMALGVVTGAWLGDVDWLPSGPPPDHPPDRSDHVARRDQGPALHGPSVRGLVTDGSARGHPAGARSPHAHRSRRTDDHGRP